MVHTHHMRVYMVRCFILNKMLKYDILRGEKYFFLENLYNKRFSMNTCGLYVSIGTSVTKLFPSWHSKCFQIAIVRFRVQLLIIATCWSLSLQPPFIGGNRQKIQQKIIKDKMKLPAFLSSEAHSLLKAVIYFYSPLIVPSLFFRWQQTILTF